ncbi:hypothetical protein [Cylindrospermum sp. FACHB-282]|uniref:hypothetical protein n=1 Tax=Cylindrospermum sp. FACHB-282 TaxID=2692794 RepID=UPI001689E414|nr:hypothetical protein [Cylindrospermum sp. FACHB-282]MBD2384930.1 hypothetical protein [Cylindrospermum sp. FACHB-282]
MAAWRISFAPKILCDAAKKHRVNETQRAFFRHHNSEGRLLPLGASAVMIDWRIIATPSRFELLLELRHQVRNLGAIH